MLKDAPAGVLVLRPLDHLRWLHAVDSRRVAYSLTPAPGRAYVHRKRCEYNPPNYGVGADSYGFFPQLK